MITWLTAVADRQAMRLQLSAARPAEVPGTADGERRKGQEYEGRVGLNCPASKMDWKEQIPGGRRKSKKTGEKIIEQCIQHRFIKVHANIF